MKKRYLLLFLISGLVLMNACQKEHSLETGNNPSEGSLQADGTGDCFPKTVAGAYVVGTALIAGTNYIDVVVNVTKAGTYTIYTDTVNGIHFRASGLFSATGLDTVRLKGIGTPAAIGISNFIVNYDGSVCTVSVNVVGTLAVFTLDGAPGACMNATPAGTYTAGTSLDASNTVTIQVTVTTAGAYNISTAVSNGIIFNGSGTLAAGAQTIVLSAAGSIPTSAGPTNIPVTVGGSSCGFNITVGGTTTPATYTVNCASAAVHGTYTVGTALSPATNTVDLSVNVTAAGTYSITATANGMTFTATGTFASAGTGQTVTLAATGTSTPTTQGVNTIQLTGGTTPCSFPVTVNPGGGGVAVFTINCAMAPVIGGTYTQGIALTASNNVVISVNVTTAGTYSMTTTTVNGMTFASAPGASFATTGAQSITLTGSGIPTAAGMFNIPIPTAACNFLLYLGPGAAATDYFPRVTNDNWSYEFDDVAADSVYRKTISTPFNALGNSYTIFMQDDGSGLDSSGYYRRNGGDYFEYLDVGSFIGYDNPGFAEYTMLKDNVAAGTNWKSAGFSGTVSGTPLQIRFSYTILQKDVPIAITTTAGSITYQNVIVVEEKYEAFNAGVWVDITSTIDFYGKSYYARGVGLIKYEALDGSNVVQDSQELRRYVVY